MEKTDTRTHHGDDPSEGIRDILRAPLLVHPNPERPRVALLLQQCAQVVLLLSCELVVLVAILLLELEESVGLSRLRICRLLKLQNTGTIKAW